MVCPTPLPIVMAGLGVVMSLAVAAKSVAGSRQSGFPLASVPHTLKGLAAVGAVTSPFCETVLSCTSNCTSVAPTTCPVPFVTTIAPPAALSTSCVVRAALLFIQEGTPPTEVTKICPKVPMPRFTQSVPSKYMIDPKPSPVIEISVPSTALS